MVFPHGAMLLKKFLKVQRELEPTAAAHLGIITMWLQRWGLVWLH